MEVLLLNLAGSAVKSLKTGIKKMLFDEMWEIDQPNFEKEVKGFKNHT